MQKIQKLIATSFSIFFLAASAYLLGGYQELDRAWATQAKLTQEQQSVSPFEYEVVQLATVLYGEAKGQPEDWPAITSAVYNRMLDTRWPDQFSSVLTYRCEIVALCDDVPERLTSSVGREALRFAESALVAMYAGTYVPTHAGHSWATPVAADGHRYFEGLCQVAEAPGHLYFGDCAPLVRSPLPRPRPDQAAAAALAEVAMRF